MNAITYKDIFPLFKDNKLWFGHNTNGHIMSFLLYDKIKDIIALWITNLDHQKRHIPLELHKHYNAEEYPKYDNYDAINVDKVKDIPFDYDDVMGVPITFLDKYCPSQFEIIGCFKNFKECDYELGFICGSPIEYKLKSGKVRTFKDPFVNGVLKYIRILIKRKVSA